MGEGNHQWPSTLGWKNSVGEIVEVQGGHIVRSTGRKDRHSKVCTAKGPRDRRVRLAAHTAIQFYDVQDRLGYDRPSKAVDWLIKKAKSAIDELAELPAWHPTACSGLNVIFGPGDSQLKPEEQYQQADLVKSNDDLHRRCIANSSNPEISSFLPPSLDSDAIADTIKSFFPIDASDETPSSSMQLQSFPVPDLMPRDSSHSQDLKLSLQSFQDPLILHHQPDQPHQARAQGQVLLSGTPLGFDSSAGGWTSLNAVGDATSGCGGAATSAGYFFDATPQLFGHNQLFSQRGPLQSSNSPSVRAWIDRSTAAVQQQPHHHPGGVPVNPSFASVYGGFTGFHIPARIQGDEEEHDGYSDKPSSASSDSRH